MHETALLNAKSFFTTYLTSFSSPSTLVVDLGSQNVNGSLREVTPPQFQYIGVDVEPGRGVDIVLDDPYRIPFADCSVDMVLSSSCFEHSEMFWILFLEVMRILKPCGLFYLNVPSAGSFHRYPMDCWRFFPDSGRALVNWSRRAGGKTQLLESFIQSTGQWKDFVGVFIKDEDQIANYSNRILDTKEDFENGIVYGKQGILKQSM